MSFGFVNSMSLINLGNTGFLLTAIIGTSGHTSGTTTVAGSVAELSPSSSTSILRSLLD